eukprot:1145140-Pyramimonas_sp.AAC.1
MGTNAFTIRTLTLPVRNRRNPKSGDKGGKILPIDCIQVTKVDNCADRTVHRHRKLFIPVDEVRIYVDKVTYRLNAVLLTDYVPVNIHSEEPLLLVRPFGLLWAVSSDCPLIDTIPTVRLLIPRLKPLRCTPPEC